MKILCQNYMLKQFSTLNYCLPSFFVIIIEENYLLGKIAVFQLRIYQQFCSTVKRSRISFHLTQKLNLCNDKMKGVTFSIFQQNSMIHISYKSLKKLLCSNQQPGTCPAWIKLNIAHAVCTKFDRFPSRGTYFYITKHNDYIL